MKNVIGLVNFHSSPDVSPITDSRPLGSTSFLGRYALCDFALSNFCNSGIDTVGLLVKDHQRSILKHLGSMDAWVRNTKTSKEIIMYNEPGHERPGINTDLQNIKENDWALYDSNANLIVVAPAHIVAPIDFRPIIAEHIARHEKITVIATKVKDKSQEFLSENVLKVSKDGYVLDNYRNPGDEKGPGIVSMSAYVINRTVLADMIHRFLPANPTLDIRTLIYQAAEEGEYQCHVHLYEGYARCFDSFPHYMQYCFELLDPKVSDQLFLPSWPIYTKSHDTPPALYGENSEVRDSIVANGAVIEGAVRHSIIGRGVKIAKGARVENAIVFSSTRIGENAVIEDALIDKYSMITRSKKVGGTSEVPLYLHQGAIL